MPNFKDFSHLNQQDTKEGDIRLETLGTFLQITYYSEESHNVSYPHRIKDSQLEEMKLKKNVIIEEIEEVRVSNSIEIIQRFVQILYDTRSDKCKAIYEMKY